jgi:AcrR family transcriptional regulator
MPKNKKKSPPAKLAYHHGHLRTALLEAALELIAEHGVATLSLREIARRAGVSHAAPAHHFGDKSGLLTALATEGFVHFLAAQRAAAERGGTDPVKRFGWTGWAYVMFAAERPAYFGLMFGPEFVRSSDPEFQHAARAAYDFLREGIRRASPEALPEQAITLRATSAWAHAHGLATLWLSGNLREYGAFSDLDRLARELFGIS